MSFGVYNYDVSENSSKATLSFAPSTGIFKGQFSLYYDYTLGRSLLHKAVNVFYTGVSTPVRGDAFTDRPAGQGYYLVPDKNPALMLYRPIRSYWVELENAP